MTPQRSVGCENMDQCELETHTINEKSSIVRYPHTTYTFEGNKFFIQKNSWIVFCFLQASCWQRDRQDSASNMPMYIQISSIPLLIEWRWEWGGGGGGGGKWIIYVRLAKSPSHPVPHANWKNHLVEGWGVEMSILLFVMCKAPKQTAAITSSTTTEGLVG